MKFGARSPAVAIPTEGAVASAGAAVGSAPGRRFPGSPQSESDRPADRASRCRMWSRECRHQHPALRCLPPDDDPHTGWGSLAPWASLGRWGASGGRNWGAGLIERGVADWIADLLRHGGEPWGCARGERGPRRRGAVVRVDRPAGSRRDTSERGERVARARWPGAGLAARPQQCRPRRHKGGRSPPQGGRSGAAYLGESRGRGRVAGGGRGRGRKGPTSARGASAGSAPAPGMAG